MQTNWVGRSEGAIIKFKLEEKTDNIEVFTKKAAVKKPAKESKAKKKGPKTIVPTKMNEGELESED